MRFSETDWEFGKFEEYLKLRNFSYFAPSSTLRHPLGRTSSGARSQKNQKSSQKSAMFQVGNRDFQENHKGHASSSLADWQDVPFSMPSSDPLPSSDPIYIFPSAPGPSCLHAFTFPSPGHLSLSLKPSNPLGRLPQESLGVVADSHGLLSSGGMWMTVMGHAAAPPPVR